jgi:hypothetical protein
MDLVYTRALYPHGGKHLGKEPTPGNKLAELNFHNGNERTNQRTGIERTSAQASKRLIFYTS